MNTALSHEIPAGLALSWLPAGELVETWLTYAGLDAETHADLPRAAVEELFHTRPVELADDWSRDLGFGLCVALEFGLLRLYVRSTVPVEVC